MNDGVDGSPAQVPLLDLSGEELNIMWVDDKQSLFVPHNPLHYKAHKYQVLLSRLDKQAQNNPAQFNSGLYKATLDEYINLVEAIGEQALDAAKLARSGQSGAETEVGAGVAVGMDSGISTDNPLSR